MEKYTMKALSGGQSTHWYGQDGQEAYGKTLREARKENLLPSVTSILKQIAKPELVNYLISQGITAALELVREWGESEESFIRRVIERSREKSKVATDFGIKVHSWIERYLTGLSVDDNDWWLPVKRWIDLNIQNPISTEDVIVDLEYGYAGKVDCICELGDGRIALIDWKTQGTKPEQKRVTKYPEWSYQLGAYFNHLPIDVFMNVVISSTEVGRIEVVEWPMEKVERALKIFLSALSVFRLSKNFPFIKEEVRND